MLSKRGCMSLNRCPSNLLNCALEYESYYDLFRHNVHALTGEALNVNQEPKN
jgi:hypothetical protein